MFVLIAALHAPCNSSNCVPCKDRHYWRTVRGPGRRHVGAAAGISEAAASNRRTGAVRSLRPSALAPFEKPRPAAAPAQLPRCSSRLTYPRVLRTAQHAQEAGNRPARKHGEPVLASGGSACLPGLVPLPAEVTRLPRNLETRLAAGPSRRRPERRPRHTLLANVLARAPAAPRAAPPKSPLWET